MTENYAASFLAEVRRIAEELNPEDIEEIARHLADVRRKGGRLFIVGVGGGAGHASHAVADFRKTAGIEAYTPTDNISEITARVNDEGWEKTLSEWLRTSKLGPDDMLLVFSVGGGNRSAQISTNIVAALDHANDVGATICGVVGRDGGHTASVADACVIVPVVNDTHVTAHTESFQAVIWHLLLGHPEVQQNPFKWESTR